MRKKYSKPATKVILIKGKKHLLTGSNDGVHATMSGYRRRDNDGDGFTQE